jgi:hypothetical protein
MELHEDEDHGPEQDSGSCTSKDDNEEEDEADEHEADEDAALLHQRKKRRAHHYRRNMAPVKKRMKSRSNEDENEDEDDENENEEENEDEEEDKDDTDEKLYPAHVLYTVKEHERIFSHAWIAFLKHRLPKVHICTILFVSRYRNESILRIMERHDAIVWHRRV